jgi:putative ABC transport system permease protein
VVGDRLRIRAPDTTGNLKAIDFQMAGVVDEFPTAPKDAFLVANIAYLAQATGNGHVSFVLARASGDAPPVAASLSTALGPNWKVDDLTTTAARLVNTVTSVDLGHLVQIDVAFALLIAAAGASLFLLAGVTDRKRELATLRAIGAEPRHMRALVLGEIAVVGSVGIGVGLIVGLVIGTMLLQVLAGIFDPAAAVPAVPVFALLGAIGAILIALGAGVLVGWRAIGRLAVMTELRER